MSLAEIFRSLGDDTRLRILNLLSNRELCVCQIIEALRITQPNASKHLNRLRYSNIISCRKIAQWCFYSLNKNFIDGNRQLLDFLQAGWRNGRQYVLDRERLNGILQNNDCCKEQMQYYKA